MGTRIQVNIKLLINFPTTSSHPCTEPALPLSLLATATVSVHDRKRGPSPDFPLYWCVATLTQFSLFSHRRRRFYPRGTANQCVGASQKTFQQSTASYRFCLSSTETAGVRDNPNFEPGRVGQRTTEPKQSLSSRYPSSASSYFGRNHR